MEGASRKRRKRTNVTQITKPTVDVLELRKEGEEGSCRFGFVVWSGDSFGSPGRTANVGQATKGTRGIPWHQQPKKDVVDHERPGRAVNRR